MFERLKKVFTKTDTAVAPQVQEPEAWAPVRHEFFGGRVRAVQLVRRGPWLVTDAGGEELLEVRGDIVKALCDLENLFERAHQPKFRMQDQSSQLSTFGRWYVVHIDAGAVPLNCAAEFTERPFGEWIVKHMNKWKAEDIRRDAE